MLPTAVRADLHDTAVQRRVVERSLFELSGGQKLSDYAGGQWLWGVMGLITDPTQAYWEAQQAN